MANIDWSTVDLNTIDWAKINYNKVEWSEVSFDDIEDLDKIDVEKLEDRYKRKYNKAVKNREAAIQALAASGQRANVIQQQSTKQPTDVIAPKTEDKEPDPPAKAPVSNPEVKPAGGEKPADEKKTDEKKTEEIKDKPETKPAPKPVTTPATRAASSKKRYIGTPYEDLVKPVPAGESILVQLKLSYDQAEELDNQTGRGRKEKNMTCYSKVALQMMMELTDKEYADVKLKAMAENKSIGTVIHEAVSAYLAAEQK